MVGLHLIERRLDLPAAVIRENQVARRGDRRVAERGDEAMRDAMAGALRVVERAADEADDHMRAMTAARIVARAQPDQRRAVTQRAERERRDGGGQAAEEVGLARLGRLDQRHILEAAVPQQQRPRADRAQQAAARPAPIGLAEPDPRVADGARAHSTSRTRSTCGQALLPRGVRRRPNARTLAGVSGSATAVLSRAMNRRSKRNAPGVAAVASGRQTARNRATTRPRAEPVARLAQRPAVASPATAARRPMMRRRTSGSAASA